MKKVVMSVLLVIFSVTSILYAQAILTGTYYANGNELYLDYSYGTFTYNKTYRGKIQIHNSFNNDDSINNNERILVFLENNVVVANGIFFIRTGYVEITWGNNIRSATYKK